MTKRSTNTRSKTEQPGNAFHALYQVWMDPVQRFRAVVNMEVSCLPATAAAVADRKAAFGECRILVDRVANIHSAASKEKQMSRRAEMNMELALLRGDLGAARARL